MFDDDNTPKNMPKKLKALDKLSVEELRDGVRDLQDEIARYEAEIAKKKAHKDAMASLFKKP